MKTTPVILTALLATLAVAFYNLAAEKLTAISDPETASKYVCYHSIAEKLDGNLNRENLCLEIAQYRSNTPPDEVAYRAHLKKTVACNPSATPRGEARLRFNMTPIFHTDNLDTRGEIIGVVCDVANTCRQRTFQFRKRIAPELLANIVIDGTLNATPNVTKCEFRRGLSPPGPRGR